jgi:hypothetical protein
MTAGRLPAAISFGIALVSYAALRKRKCCHANKSIAAGIWHTLNEFHSPHRSGTPMSKAASITHTPSAAFFSRFIAALDRLLMANAQIAVRNNDLPYFGL